MSKNQNANKKTLDTQHINKLQEFSNNDTNISKLQKEIEALQNKLKKFKPRNELSDSEFDNYIALTDQLSILKKQMDKLESLDDEIDYYMNTAPILFQYYDILENGKNVNNIRKPVATEKSILKYFMQPASSNPPLAASTDGGGKDGANANANNAEENTMDRASLLEKYMHVTDSNYIKPIQDEPKDRCPHCASNDRIIMINDGLIYCNNCNTVEYIIIDHERPSYKDPPKEMESPKAFRNLKLVFGSILKLLFSIRFLKVLFKRQC